MKKHKESRAKRLMFVALGIMAMIFGIMCLVSPEAAVGSTMAMAFVIGGVTYEDNEIGKAIGDIAAKFDDKIKGAVTKEDIEKLKSEFATQVNALKNVPTNDELKTAVDDLNTKLQAQWEEVVKLNNNKPANERPKSLGESLKEAIIASGAVEKYTDATGAERYKFKNFDSKKATFEIKAAIDMNTALAVRPGATPGVSQGYLTDWGMIPQEFALTTNQHLLTAGFPVEGTTEKYYGVIIETDEVDGANVKVETGAAGDSSWMWDTDDFKVFDFAVKFRIHQNTLDDIDNVMNRAQSIGIDRLLSKIDYFALGSAGDNSATPYGILNAGKFTAYDTTLRAHEVQGANIVNVIKNGVLQANKANQVVNTILLNSSDIAEIEDLKDLNNNTVNLAGVRLDATGKLAYVYGLRVIRNDNLTANSFILLDINESFQFGKRKELAFKMGYDKDSDFSKGIVTGQLETRLAIGLGNPARIIYCSDIAAAQTELSVV